MNGNGETTMKMPIAMQQSPMAMRYYVLYRKRVLTMTALCPMKR